MSSKKKQRKAEKLWIEEYQKLKKRENVCRKQMNGTLQRTESKSYFYDMRDICDWNEIMQNERNSECLHLTNKYLLSTKKSILIFNSFINSKMNDKSCAKIESIANIIEDKFMQFKSEHNSKYQKLEKEQKILSQELLFVTEEVFEDNANGNQPRNRKPATKRNMFNFENDSRPQKLIEIQEMIDEYGRDGGWPANDHRHFIRLYIQIPSDKELLLKLSEVLPKYSLTQLRKHLQWFDSYERLWENKREIIKEWKAQKIQKAKQLKIKENAEPKNTSKMKEMAIAEERERKKIQISDWKSKKERIAQMKERKEKLNEEKFQALRKIKSRERMREMKQLLTEMVIKKKTNDLLTIPNNIIFNEQRIKKRKENKKHLHQFQTRDLLLLEHKKRKKTEKQRIEEEKEYKFCDLVFRSQPNLTHIQSIFLQNTHSRNLKLRQKKKRNEAGNAFEEEKKCSPLRTFVDSNTTKSIPLWRRGL